MSSKMYTLDVYKAELNCNIIRFVKSENPYIKHITWTYWVQVNFDIPKTTFCKICYNRLIMVNKGKTKTHFEWIDDVLTELFCTNSYIVHL